MLDHGWKRWLSGLLALALVVGMLPPVAVRAEEGETTPVTQATEAIETTEATEPPETEETTEATETTEPSETEETTEATEVEETEPTETVETEPAETEAEETLPDETREEIELYSETGIVASGTCGESLTWTLDEEGTLTICGTGDMENYSWSSNVPWYSYQDTITSAVIEEGVTSVGGYAFYGCSNLTRITIPKGVTSIGLYAFACCSKLTHVTLPESITFISNWVFNGCTSLTDIFYSGTLNSLAKVWYKAPDLTGVTIHHKDGEGTFTSLGICGDNLMWTLDKDGVLHISGTGAMDDYNWDGSPWYSYTSQISALVLDDGIANIGQYAFTHCSKLTEVTIPASVSYIAGYAFRYCDTLADIYFLHRPWNPLKLDSGAFAIDGYVVTSLYTRVHVLNLKEIPAALTAYNWSGSRRVAAYLAADSIPVQTLSITSENTEAEVGVSITYTVSAEPTGTTSDILWSIIPGTGTATVTRQGVVTGLTAGTVTVRATSGDNGDIYAEASLTILPPTGGDPTAITVTTGGLYENEVAADETIPMQAVFTPANASSRNITWEVQNGTGTAKIDQQGNLTGLTPGSVTVYATADNGIENSCTVNVVRYTESIQILFDGKSDTTSMGIGEMKYLTAVLIPENTTTTEVEWWIVRGTGAAELKTSYKYDSNGNKIQVGRIAGTEAGTVTVVATAKDSHAVVARAELEIKDTIRTYAVIGGNIYYNTETGWITGSDSTVTNAVIPSQINGTTIVGIAPDAFANVNNSWHDYNENTTLTSVSIPATVKEIGKRAFYNCTALSNLRVSGTSQLTTIGERAFYYCKSLTNLTIPEGVTTVGDEAFCYLSGLKNLTISGEADSRRWGFGYYYDECLESITYTGSYIRSGERTTYPSGGYSTESGVFCSAKKLILSDGITSIGDYAFTGGYNITTEVVLGEYVTSIGKYAFSGCSGLTTINLPESLTYLGEGCFESCSKLDVVDLSQIPDTISDAKYLLNGKATLPNHIIKATDGKVSFYWSVWSATDDYSDAYPVAYVINYTNGKTYLECQSSGKIKLNCTDEYTGLRGSKIIEVKAGLQIRPTDLGYLTSGQSVTLSAWMMPSETEASVYWELAEGDEAYATLTSAGKLTAKTVPQAQQIRVSAVPYSGGETVTKSIWILPKVTGLSITQNGDPLTSETEVDMHQSTTLNLAATSTPADASNDVTWSTSDKNIAMVNENGKVTLLKPGTATITATATDGSKKTAKVTMTVYYLDKTTKLAATSNAPALGLQPGQTATVTVSGSSQLAQKELIFSIPASQQKIATVDKETGIVTAGTTPGTVTVTATLRDDPLNRKATVKINVIDMQALELKLFADATETDTVILDAEAVSDHFYEFTVSARVLTYLNEWVDSTNVTWVSGNTAIATVTDNKDGTATVTIKKGASGECAITATSKDAAKVAANLWLSVRDYAPRLESTSLSMNLYQSSTVEIGLAESYENSITDVSIDGDFDATWADGTLAVTAQEGVTKGTYTQTLTVICANGETYDYTLKIKVTETAPTVTVKQSGKYNLFYTDGIATLTVTAKGATVENVTVTDGDFSGEYADGTLTLTCNGVANPSKKVTLEIQVAGYEKPVEKAVTLSTVTTAPKLKLSAASSVINTELGEKSTTFQVLDSGKVLDLAEEDVAYSGSFADCTVANNAITLTITGTTGGTATLNIQKSNWTKSVKLTHKVTIQTTLPTMKLGTTTLKLNKVFPELTGETALSLSQSNVPLADVTVTPKTTEAGKIDVFFENGKLVAEITDGSIKTGTYSYTCVGVLENGDTLKAVTLKITVSATSPKIKLASTTLKLNRYLAGQEQVSTKVTVPAGYTLAGFDGLEGTPLTYADGYLTACLEDESDNGGSYAIYPIVVPDGGEEEVTLSTKLTVKVTTYRSSSLSATVTTKGKLDTLNPDGAITCTVKLKNCTGPISGVSLSGQDGDLFHAETDETGNVILTLKEGEDYATNKTYKVTLDMLVCGQTVSKAISFKVTQSALKLTASPVTLTCYQATGRVATILTVTSPTTAQIADVTLGSKTTAAFRKALGEDGLHFDAETGKVKLTLQNPGLLTPGKSYTLYLDVTPQGNAENVKLTQVKLTVKVQK